MESLSDLDDVSSRGSPDFPTPGALPVQAKKAEMPALSLCPSDSPDSRHSSVPHPLRENEKPTGTAPFNLLSLLLPLPNRRDGVKQGGFIETKTMFKVADLPRPIGVSLLPSSSLLAVSCHEDDTVRLLDAKTGSERGRLQSPRGFRSPSDMALVGEDLLIVRDRNGLQGFNANGKFVREIGAGIIGVCYGIAVTAEGNIVTLNQGSARRATPGNRGPRSNAAARLAPVTAPGSVDVLVLDPNSGRLIDRIELEDVVSDKEKSKCRFLYCKGRKVYIADLGLDLVYILDLKRGNVRTFGGSGKELDRFSDPAGIVADDLGNMIVADSRNHELKIFNKSRNFCGLIRTGRQLRRPSGILLDAAESELIVLNLWGNSLVKFKLHQPKVQLFNNNYPPATNATHLPTDIKLSTKFKAIEHQSVVKLLETEELFAISTDAHNKMELPLDLKQPTETNSKPVTDQTSKVQTSKLSPEAQVFHPKLQPTVSELILQIKNVISKELSSEAQLSPEAKNFISSLLPGSVLSEAEPKSPNYPVLSNDDVLPGLEPFTCTETISTVGTSSLLPGVEVGPGEGPLSDATSPESKENESTFEGAGQVILAEDKVEPLYFTGESDNSASEETNGSEDFGPVLPLNHVLESEEDPGLKQYFTRLLLSDSDHHVSLPVSGIPSALVDPILQRNEKQEKGV